MDKHFIDCHFCDRFDISILEEDGIVSHLMRREFAALMIYLSFYNQCIFARNINCVIFVLAVERLDIKSQKEMGLEERVSETKDQSTSRVDASIDIVSDLLKLFVVYCIAVGQCDKD